MTRSAITYLKTWLNNSKRLPMIVRGARQVGKTYTVRELAKITGMQLIEVNFERHIHAASLFSCNDPKRILLNLEAHFSISIKPNQSILFLDEIQSEPDVLATLRWFAEEMPELAVIAAGSLLDFALEKHQFSMPVGRVTYMYMQPLSFEEYLTLSSHQKLLDFIESTNIHDPIPEGIHHQLMGLFNEYTLVGGMPAALHSWINQRSLSAVQTIHLDLLASYRNDFSKYSGKIDISRLDDILLALPRLLGKKLVYSYINPDVKSASLKKALELLTKARVCQKVYACSGNGIPLMAEANAKNNKLVFLDTGLITSQLGLMLHDLQSTQDLNLINNGTISEHVVGQLLQTIEPFYVDPPLCYWNREAKSSNAEIDYLIQHKNQVIPIEVKSGKSGSMKSLHLFMKEKTLPLAVRINSEPPSEVTVNLEHTHYQLLSLPFYMIGQLHHLIENTIKFPNVVIPLKSGTQGNA